MKKILIILLLLLGSGLVFAQEAKLEYRMAKDTKINFKERIQSHVTTLLFGEKISENESLVELLIKENVLESNDKSFKSKQEVSFQKCLSDGEDKINEMPAEDRNNVIIYEMEKNGYVTFLGDKDGKQNENFQSDKDEFLFPVNSVKVGDTWKCKRNIDGKKVWSVCTLEKLYSDNGVDIAKIKISVDDKITENNNETGETCDIFVKGEGYYYFAVNFGNDLYMYYDIEFKTKIDTKLEENPINLEITNNYKYQYWRCE